MKTLLFIAFFATFFSYAQDNANNWTVPISATINESPVEITLHWTENTGTGTQYNIFRKVKGTSGWGSSIGSVAVGDTSFTDNTVTVGISYEYLIQKVQGASLQSWGYINAGIRTELPYNRGDLLLLVDSVQHDLILTELTQLEEDLYNDGWMVTKLVIGSSLSPIEVKDEILNQYNLLNNLKTVYLLGHIPVPFSGNIAPDGHTPDHQGAWPADVYYADMNGNWTDASVNVTAASGTRNDNVPGDGKFDQSVVPSSLELQVCRVDFNNLPVYSETEDELLKSYLDKVHEFKIANDVPTERALYDQGGFTGYTEGFAQNGIRNFVPFVGHDNVFEVDYFTTLSTDDYLWSYGCGAGSYTSAGGLDGGSSLTSSELAGTPINAYFTMLFGSYFGDWDTTNNFMRVAMASGSTLSCSWAGRPNWHYHTLAQGDNIGVAALMAQDQNPEYTSLNSTESIHIAQLGDPSLRTYYVQPASNLNVSNNNNEADLSWTASADGGIDGYNIYRRTSSTLWEKVNTAIVTGTSYTDNTIPHGAEWEYMVKAVKLKTNFSGSFYNESLGTTGTAKFTVSVYEPNVKLNIYPNPATDVVFIESGELIQNVKLINVEGRILYSQSVNSEDVQVEIVNLPSGSYFVIVETANGIIKKQIIKN